MTTRLLLLVGVETAAACVDNNRIDYTQQAASSRHILFFSRCPFLREILLRVGGWWSLECHKHYHLVLEKVGAVILHFRFTTRVGKRGWDWVKSAFFHLLGADNSIISSFVTSADVGLWRNATHRTTLGKRTVTKLDWNLSVSLSVVSSWAGKESVNEFLRLRERRAMEQCCRWWSWNVSIGNYHLLILIDLLLFVVYKYSKY